MKRKCAKKDKKVICVNKGDSGRKKIQIIFVPQLSGKAN